MNFSTLSLLPFSTRRSSSLFTEWILLSYLLQYTRVSVMMLPSPNIEQKKIKSKTSMKPEEKNYIQTKHIYTHTQSLSTSLIFGKKEKTHNTFF